MKKMKAAVFESIGVLKIKEVDVPKIQKGDDIICKVEVCSICGTDVHIMAVPPGYIAEPGTILGHELVAEVVETGESVKTLKKGDRIVVNPNDYCGVCRYCRMNLPNQCESIIPMGIGADGGFAEYVRMSEKVAHKIPADMKAEIAAYAEPLACAVNGINKLRANPGESAVVIGGGPIGLLFVQLLKQSGVGPLIVSEPSENRREFAKKCGADYVVDPAKQDLAEFVLEKTGLGADMCIEVVGSQLPAAVDAVRKGGKVLLFGVNAKAFPEVQQRLITIKEISVLGTWLANATFPRAVEILAGGKLTLDFMVTHVLPLEKTLEGIELLKTGEGVEILIDMRL